MRRAGLDYHEWTNIIHYKNTQDFIEKNTTRRIFACTTKTQENYANVRYQDDDMFLFGPETRGLPPDVRERYHPIKIPMLPTSRSLNLSNAVAIILFEAWRQLDFIVNAP